MLTINADQLPRFMACNGSRLLAGEVPPANDMTARDEGTAAHYMAVTAFNRRATLEELIDRKAPNGVYMTSDMAQHVDAYLQAISDDAATFRAMEVDTSHDRSPQWVVNGRADFVAQVFNSTLRIADFKYGWRIIEPENNWTLISHALGIWAQRQFSFQTIELQIFQPRPHHADGPLRTWRLSMQDLQLLYEQLNASLSNPSDLTRTGNHCHGCPALYPCGSARLASMNAIDQVDTAFADTIDNATLSLELDTLNRASDMIKHRLEALEELAQHRIRAGQVVDNYSAEIGFGHTRWKEGIDGAMLKALTGKDLTIAKTVTPAEAKRQGVPECVIKPLTERPTTGVKLVRVKASKKAERIFGTKN